MSEPRISVFEITTQETPDHTKPIVNVRLNVNDDWDKMVSALVDYEHQAWAIEQMQQKLMHNLLSGKGGRND